MSNLPERRSLVAIVTIAIAVAMTVDGCGAAVTTASPGSAAPTTSSAPPFVPAASGPASSSGATSSSVPASPRAATSSPSSAAAIRVVATVARFRLPRPLSRSAAVTLGNAVLVCGGLTPTGTTADVMLFDPAGRRVTTIGRLATPVHDAAAAAVGPRAFVFGGGSLVAGSTVQLVDPLGGSRLVGRLPAPRADVAAVTVGGAAIVVGGGTPLRPDPAVLSTADGVHFSRIATLAVAVRYPAVAAVGGKIYVIGGSTPGGDSNAIQVIDPSTRTVAIVGRLPFALSDAAALVIGGRLLVLGGRRAGVPLDTIFVVDPRTGSAREVGHLPYRVADAPVIVVDGVGYLIGGEAATQLASIVAIRVG